MKKENKNYGIPYGFEYVFTKKVSYLLHNDIKYFYPNGMDYYLSIITFPTRMQADELLSYFRFKIEKRWLADDHGNDILFYFLGCSISRPSLVLADNKSDYLALRIMGLASELPDGVEVILSHDLLRLIVNNKEFTFVNYETFTYED